MPPFKKKLDRNLNKRQPTYSLAQAGLQQTQTFINFTRPAPSPFRCALCYPEHQNCYIYKMKWQDYIVSDKQVLLGKPTIKDTRISVELILELLESGWNEKQILESYPSLTENSIRAVFAYLKDCLQQELYFPISA